VQLAGLSFCLSAERQWLVPHNVPTLPRTWYLLCIFLRGVFPARRCTSRSGVSDAPRWCGCLSRQREPRGGASARMSVLAVAAGNLGRWGGDAYIQINGCNAIG